MFFLKKLILMSLLGFSLVNCGGSSSPSVVNAYNGAGSKWDIVLSSDDTFSITHKVNVSSATDMTIEGSYTTLDSGFLKLTITSAVGTSSDLPSEGDTGYGLEIDGYAFFLQPTESAGEVITMIQAGNCPSGDIDGNWITVRNLHNINASGQGTSIDVSDVSQDVFGVFSWDNSTNIISLPNQYSLAAPTTDLLRPFSTPVTCTDGIATLDGATMYLTSNGGAIVHTENDNGDGTTDESIITAFAAETLVAATDFDGNYAGVLVNSDSSASDAVQPVSVSCSAGTCTGTVIDPETNAAPASGGGSAIIALTGTLNSPSSGFINGTITIGGSLGAITCMIDTNAANTTKTLISCSGQEASDNTKLFNVLLVSK